MYNKIILFFRGYLIIAIKGNALERFINQLINTGIYINKVNRIRKDYYKAEIRIKDFKKIRKIVRKRMCSVSILEKKGLPFKINFAINNK